MPTRFYTPHIMTFPSIQCILSTLPPSSFYLYPHSPNPICLLWHIIVIILHCHPIPVHTIPIPHYIHIHPLMSPPYQFSHIIHPLFYPISHTTHITLYHPILFNHNIILHHPILHHTTPSQLMYYTISYHLISSHILIYHLISSHTIMYHPTYTFYTHIPHPSTSSPLIPPSTSAY
jgi:hypothetical protein